MLPFSKGAALVIGALKRLEDERETIWTARALLAITGLSPVESMLARALCSDSVWTETMRTQLRQAETGQPGYAHLQGQLMSTGFYLRVLLPKAEQAAVVAGDAEIAERHLARALVDMLREDLRRQAIDGERLVAEVIEMERGPQEERIRKALELERLQFSKEQDQIRQAASKTSDSVRANSAARGLSSSGLHMGRVIEAHVDMIRQMAIKRVEIRRETVRRVPELASPDQITQLRQEIDSMVDAQWGNLHIGVARWSGSVAAEAEARRLLDLSQFADTPLQIKSIVGRDLGILEREASLGMASATVGGHSVTINIQDSTVAALNLGTVMGNLQTAVTTLQQGDPEISTALQKVIEVVAAEESLGDHRREVIESLSQIGEEATRPEAQRRIGLVKTLLGGVAAALAQAANVAQIWQTYGSAIARHFGLPLP